MQENTSIRPDTTDPLHASQEPQASQETQDLSLSFSQLNEQAISNYENSKASTTIYSNETEPSDNEIDFTEKWKSLVSECLNLGLTVDNLKDKEPSSEIEFKELEKIIEDIYFNSALVFEKKILPSSIQAEQFLNTIKIEKGRSSKDIFLLSKLKYNFIQLGFKFETHLGTGFFGEVWKCSILNEEYINKYKSEFIAVKFQLEKEGITSPSQEFSLMVSNKHPNIVKFLDYLKDCNALIMQYCSNGSLDKFLLNQTEPISKELSFKFAEQICNALEYLHERGIFHRDIRISNILLDEELNIKIADFGIAIFNGVELNKKFENILYNGKGIYGGLEAINDEKKYASIDIRFFGIVLLKFLHFGEYSKICGKKTANLEREFPSDCHPNYKHFVVFCLKSNPFFEFDGIKIIKLLLKSLEHILLGFTIETGPSKPLENQLSKSQFDRLLYQITNNSDDWITEMLLCGLKKTILNCESINTLVRCLEYENFKYKLEISRILSKQNLNDCPDAISTLIKLLDDENTSEVKKYAARAIGRNLSSCPSSIDSLIKLFNGSSKYLRNDVVTNLLKNNLSNFFNTFLVYFSDASNLSNYSPNINTREESELQSPPKDEIDKLILQLQDNDNHVRSIAAFKLGKVNLDSYPEIIDSLIQALNDTDSWVRSYAAQSLGNQNLTHPDAADSLIQSLLKDRDKNVRGYIASSLEKQNMNLLKKHLEILQKYVLMTNDPTIQRIIFKIEQLKQKDIH